MQLETMLEEHTVLYHSLYEALAMGSATDEMENEATQVIERATHILLKIVKDAHIQDLDRVRKLLTRFTAHCETWDVVNDQDISPANDIFKIFKGDFIAINKIYKILLFEEVHGQDFDAVVDHEPNSSDEVDITSGWS